MIMIQSTQTPDLLLAESENVSADSVFHLDAFLYDDELEQRLVEEGAIPRALCNKCGSRDTTPISKLINHHANSSGEKSPANSDHL